MSADDGRGKYIAFEDLTGEVRYTLQWASLIIRCERSVIFQALASFSQDCYTSLAQQLVLRESVLDGLAGDLVCPDFTLERATSQHIADLIAQQVAN